MADPTQLDALQTPALLLDRGRLCRNIDRYEARARGLGVALRPHLKTAKAIAVADLLPSARAHGITVSTVKEVEYFARHGIGDVFYAVGAVPQKTGRLAALARETGATVRIALDDAGAARAVAAAVDGAALPVLLEIDCGEHRGGLAPDAAALLPLAELVHQAPQLELTGVFTHAGHGYDCRDAAALRRVARAERDAVVCARDRLAAAGLPCSIVSVGSTPTLAWAESLAGVTEARAGVFVFGDLFQAALGTCAPADIALSVLATVIGRRPEQGRVLIDAGALALSKDRSTAALGPDGDAGYGLVCDARGAPLPGLRVVAAYQEHGVIEGPDGIDVARFPVGTRLRVLPNHACMTAAQYDRYHVVEDGAVTAVWPRINEWV